MAHFRPSLSATSDAGMTPTKLTTAMAANSSPAQPGTHRLNTRPERSALSPAYYIGLLPSKLVLHKGHRHDSHRAVKHQSWDFQAAWQCFHSGMKSHSLLYASCRGDFNMMLRQFQVKIGLNSRAT